MRLTCLLPVVALLAATAPTRAQPPPPPAAAPAFAPAQWAWLSGCWASDSGDTRYDEHWLAPAADGLLGVSRRVQNGRTADTELMRIVATADGVDYIAHPVGQSAITFRLQRLNAQEAVFENPAHDFPTRIAYRSEAPNRLMATLSGKADQPPRVLQWQRGACPAATATAGVAAANLPPTTAPGLPPRPAHLPANVETIVTYKERYSDTGCSRGLFLPPLPGRWQESAPWDDLTEGMTMPEVEKLLGVEHYDVPGSNGVLWQYGKCGKTALGSVLFENGRVTGWRAPAF